MNPYNLNRMYCNVIKQNIEMLPRRQMYLMQRPNWEKQLAKDWVYHRLVMYLADYHEWKAYACSSKDSL